MPESEIIEKLVISNLRRAQAFDSTLRSANRIDTIADKLADAILYQPNAQKRVDKIGELVSEIVSEANRKIIPQGVAIGNQNAKDIISKIPQSLDLASSTERGAALFRQKANAAQRMKIIQTSVEANGKQLDRALTKYWLEPAEGTNKQKVKRLQQIHTTMEEKRKTYEKETQKFNEGVTKKRPSKPNLDYVSEMTNESKKDIRVQARRSGTDAEIATFQAEGYQNFIWIAPNGIFACPDCQNRQNAVMTMRLWEQVGRPGSGQTICAINCFCMLLPEETAASAPLLITSRNTTERGPLTSPGVLKFLNSRRIEKTK